MDNPKAPFILKAGEVQPFDALQIWWVIPDSNAGCSFEIESSKGTESCHLNIGEAGMLGFRGDLIRIKTGGMAVQPAQVISLAKLQAFIDSAIDYERKQFQCAYGFSLHRTSAIPGGRLFENWLIGQHLQPMEGQQRIVSLLRETEWYWVVSFLLTAGEESSLKKLGERYGLSTSHFRRLSKAALGNTTKVEMCCWRLTRALMDLIGDEMSITDIAVKNGYASLSHFSNDVKNMFGVSPRELKNVINCDSK